MTAQGNALGNKSATVTQALKGRNKMFNPTNGQIFRPFRACAIRVVWFPGRCPGLTCYGPVGANRSLFKRIEPCRMCHGPVSAGRASGAVTEGMERATLGSMVRCRRGS